MATAASVLQAFRRPATQARAQLGWRDNFVTILMGLWLMIGLFVDGWAHNNLRNLETFFTPWHAIFYSGFLANVAWLAWLIVGQYRAGRVGLAAIPQGYHLGVIGVFVFGAGGVGDMIWHIVFGIERDLEALLSPTHLLLFLGGSLIFGSPFLAAWLGRERLDDRLGFRAFLPTLASLALMTSFASFMNMYLWALFNHYETRSSLQNGLEDILITNVILLAPVLLMLRRWRVPFGSVTFMYALNTIMMSALVEFRARDEILVAVLAGLVADLLIQALRPWNGRAASFRAIAVLIPLVLWSLHFLERLLTGGIAWSIEFTTGVTVMAALSGLALSLLMAPPAIPARAD